MSSRNHIIETAKTALGAAIAAAGCTTRTKVSAEHALVMVGGGAALSASGASSHDLNNDDKRIAVMFGALAGAGLGAAITGGQNLEKWGFGKTATVALGAASAIGMVMREVMKNNENDDHHRRIG